jgi:ketosteroid isomerase-like protein
MVWYSVTQPIVWFFNHSSFLRGKKNYQQHIIEVFNIAASKVGATQTQQEVGGGAAYIHTSTTQRNG